MLMIFEVNLDDQQIKGREKQISTDIQFAISGALNLYRDDGDRSGQQGGGMVIDYEILVREDP